MTSTHRRHREQKPASRRLLLLVVVLMVVIGSVALSGSSSASFVSSTRSTGTVTAAADWTPPAVSVTAPASVIKGSVPVAVTVTDAGSGIATVTVQRATVDGSSWTTICTTSTAPFTCAWDTTSVEDGSHTLRAIAVDTAGNTTTSAPVSTIVANSLTIVLRRPADVVSTSIALTSTLADAGAVTPTVRVEYAPAGSSTWTTLCTTTSAPYSCSASTASIANGMYDLRSVATAGSATYTSAVVAGVMIDHLAPTVTMGDPGTPLRGTKTFTATASDAHSGVAKVVIQASSGGSWNELCTVTTAPFSCSVDTGTLANATYSFRAVATDRAGNTTTSSTVTNRVVQNATSSVVLASPGATLRGTVGLTATVTTNGTIASAKFQRSVAGAGTWTDICTDTVSPYTCSFNTSGLADGSYDLRAVVTDTSGRATPSAVVANRVVDNTAGKGVDIQTTNGGTAGRIDAGDTMVFTFSEQMDLSSIYAGWSGTATSGSVQVRDGLIYGGGVNSDVLELSRPSGADLGSVNMDANFVTLFTVSTNVTLTAATVTQDGVARTVVTLRIDGSGTGNQVSTPADMTWTPAGSILDLAGNPISTAAVTESGQMDVDF
jgi:chitinase